MSPAHEFLTKFNSVYNQTLLFAIHKDGGPPRTFAAPTVDAAVQWAEELNPHGWNIYFHVNVGEGSRLAKEDVTHVRALHADVDPPKNLRPGTAEYDWWCKECHRMLVELWPTYILFSGRGLQAFWLLENAVPVASKRVRANVERMNGSLLLYLGTDTSTRDISRVMKVPGFVAWPNAGKAAAGWQPQWATVWHRSDVCGDDQLRWLRDERLPEFDLPHQSTDPRTGLLLLPVVALSQAVEEPLSQKQQDLVKKVLKKWSGGKNARWVAHGIPTREDADASRVLHWMMHAAAEDTPEIAVMYHALIQTGFYQRTYAPTGYTSRQNKCEIDVSKNWERIAAEHVKRRKENQDLVSVLVEELERKNSNVR